MLHHENNFIDAFAKFWTKQFQRTQKENGIATASKKKKLYWTFKWFIKKHEPSYSIKN